MNWGEWTKLFFTLAWMQKLQSMMQNKNELLRQFWNKTLVWDTHLTTIVQLCPLHFYPGLGPALAVLGTPTQHPKPTHKHKQENLTEKEPLNHIRNSEFITVSLQYIPHVEWVIQTASTKNATITAKTTNQTAQANATIRRKLREDKLGMCVFTGISVDS